ncbi:MAG: TRAP transporter substrate-binding protein [Bacillota bacterium]
MKLKKALLLAFCMVVAMFALTACGGGEEEAPAEGEAANEDGTYTIRIAHTEAEDRSLNMACLEFGKWIEAESDGAVTVEVYPNGSFSGSDSDILQATALGQLEIGLPAAQAFTEYSPEWGILDMPFLFDSADAYFNAMDGDLGAALTETLEGTGFHMLGYAFMGVKQITNSVRPVKTVADLEGLKMRTQQSDAHIAMYEAMGANPTPMSFGEVFTALQQGTVDGQDQTGTIIWAQKWYEAQKYMTITNHNYGTMCFVANEEWFNGLPDDIKALVEEGAKTYLIDWQRQYELDAEAECQQKIADAGLEVYTPTAEELQTFVDACVPVNEKYAQEWGQEWFDMAAAANEAVK